MPTVNLPGLIRKRKEIFNHLGEVLAKMDLHANSGDPTRGWDERLEWELECFAGLVQLTKANLANPSIGGIVLEKKVINGQLNLSVMLLDDALHESIWRPQVITLNGMRIQVKACHEHESQPGVRLFGLVVLSDTIDVATIDLPIHVGLSISLMDIR